MSKIEQTIESLVADSPAVRPVRPAALLARWAVLTLLSSGLISAYMGLRPDLASQLHQPLYLSEILCLAALTVTTALAAVYLCYPDLRQRPRMLWLPALPFGLFVGLCGWRLLHPELTVIPPPAKVDGWECVRCVTLYALIPGFWMFHILRRQATTHPGGAGTIAVLASASIGVLMLKIIEANDSVAHLVQWHLLPSIILTGLGFLLGRKFLSW